MKNYANRGGGRDNTLQYLPNSLHVSFKSRIQSLFQLLFIQNISNLKKREYLDLLKDPVFISLVNSSGISGYEGMFSLAEIL